MFLIDTSSPKQKGLPVGGTVIKALDPMGLAYLLDPLTVILNQQLTSQITFGDTILRLRHSYLVHGDFSPRRIEYLIAQSQIRRPQQIERFVSLLWDLFYQIIILRLTIVAFFTHEGIHIESAILSYLQSISPLRKSKRAS